MAITVDMSSCQGFNGCCLSAGEVGSGKTTLVAKLQGVEDYMKGRGLEYLYFSVHDDDVDGNRLPIAV